jgi:hypothetical protein
VLSIQPSKFSYRPTIDSLKREYARRVAHMIMKKRREEQYGPRTPSKITDNSEPWLENPNSVADYWYISEQVRKRAEQWGPLQTDS